MTLQTEILSTVIADFLKQIKSFTSVFRVRWDFGGFADLKVIITQRKYFLSEHIKI